MVSMDTSFPVVTAAFASMTGKDVSIDTMSPVHPRQWKAAPAEASKPTEEAEVKAFVGKEANASDAEEASAASVPAKKPGLQYCVGAKQVAPSNKKEAEVEAVVFPAEAASAAKGSESVDRAIDRVGAAPGGGASPRATRRASRDNRLR